jgi:hypothetical protein
MTPEEKNAMPARGGGDGLILDFRFVIESSIQALGGEEIRQADGR